MFKKVTTPLAILALSSLPIIAGAATTVTIDAYQHCLDVSTMTGKAASFQLAPGRYVASISGNKMSCAYGNLTGGCLINSITIRSVLGTAGYGLSVINPTVIDVPGPSNNTFSAFIADAPCGDNTGKATLNLQKAQ